MIFVCVWNDLRRPIPTRPFGRDLKCGCAVVPLLRQLERLEQLELLERNGSSRGFNGSSRPKTFIKVHSPNSDQCGKNYCPRLEETAF